MSAHGGSLREVAVCMDMAFSVVNAPETSVPTLSSDIVPHAGAVRPMSAKPPPVTNDRICGLKGVFRFGPPAAPASVSLVALQMKD